MPRYSTQFDQYLEFKTEPQLINDLTLQVLDGLRMERVNRKAYKVAVEKIIINLFTAWKTTAER